MTDGASTERGSEDRAGKRAGERAIVVALPGNEALATTLARLLGAELLAAAVRSFPDGESLVRIEGLRRGAPVVLCCTLDRPDPKLFRLVLAARGARDMGAGRIGLVAPYLPYLRQDAAFRPGEVISAHHLGWLLSGCFDWLVTVEPHLHRLPDLPAVLAIEARAVAAAPVIAAWVRANVRDPVLVGPDDESAPWTEAVAALSGAPWIVARKERGGDRDVRVRLPPSPLLAGRTPVVVDDVVSTGTTLAETVRELRAAGHAPPACVAVHAVFAGGAERALREAGAASVVTCDTIPHRTNAMSVAPLVAEAVAEIIARER